MTEGQQTKETVRYAGIECGGTSFVVAIAEGSPDNIVDRFECPTNNEDPNITLKAVEEWLDNQKFDALGVASFGPVDVVEDSPTFGQLLNTPKFAWQHVDVFKRFTKRYDVPAVIDTDVNAPAYAEVALSNGQLTSCAYITVGTGIGGGVHTRTGTIHNGLHPEAGHVQVRPHPADVAAGYDGECPFHKGMCCVEGMAKAKSIATRAGVTPAELKSVSDDHPVWAIVGHYLAQMCLNITLVTAVEKIAIGGGVLNRACIYPKIRESFAEAMNGYVQFKELEDLETYIGPSRFGSSAGIVGACALGVKALEDAKGKQL
ncbi:hypothetical protein J8273_2531 [Carpediemonas membranifera]|uniref:fructokinase n=1 Tax=Carpediemonas membranifera TaxID=201153 RepID=A0A8J6B9R7_9EUKA|nr:hypothetical protein J8273_2531 [Carpediemonas membranifera]|eukprot:KAG9396179.1 hypothetical protein J8273_2531 [Carpediemonas membranifera]